MHDDLRGAKFGRLLVEEVVGKAKNRTILWKCRCDCGNTTVVRANHLKSSHTVSCGCVQKERIPGVHFPDFIGRKFGKLTVIELTSDKRQRANVWLCACLCGNYVGVKTSSLVNGHTRSCGCLQEHRNNTKYCIGWNGHVKKYIKHRDGESCLNPYCSRTDNLLSVHHIDYNKKNCSTKNLIVVCRSCNIRANKDKEWHTAWYRAVLRNRYGYNYN